MKNVQEGPVLVNLGLDEGFARGPIDLRVVCIRSRIHQFLPRSISRNKLLEANNNVLLQPDETLPFQAQEAFSKE